MNSDYLPEPPLGVFSIEIAAPGGSSADWRPFAGQELPLAEYARQIAERFDFKGEVSEITTVGQPQSRRLGIILIDPWFVASPDGRAVLESAVAGLPKWVLPVLILARPGDARTEELAAQVRDILFAAGVLYPRSARRGARGVSSLRAFSVLVRDLVLEADGQYIRHFSRQRHDAPVPSRQSGSQSGPPMPSRPDRFASAPDPLGETPDAR